MTIMLFDFVIVALAAALGALLMHWHYDAVKTAVDKERRVTEFYCSDSIAVRIDAARRDGKEDKEWNEQNWTPAPNIAAGELVLDEAAAKELKANKAVVRTRRCGK